MGKFYITTEFLYRSTIEIQADSEEEAITIWEEMPLEEIVGKKIVDISELEDGTVIDVYEVS